MWVLEIVVRIVLNSNNREGGNGSYMISGKLGGGLGIE